MLRVHDEDWEARTRASFARQRMMDTLGVRIADLAPGRCVLEMPYDERFTQQHGYAHAGATATLADSACGYAAYTLAAPDATVLTVEYKINLLAPAAGDRFRATAAGASRLILYSTVSTVASGAASV